MAPRGNQYPDAGIDTQDICLAAVADRKIRVWFALVCPANSHSSLAAPPASQICSGGEGGILVLMFNSLTEISRNAGDSSKEGKTDLVIICLTFRKVRKLTRPRGLGHFLPCGPWHVSCCRPSGYQVLSERLERAGFLFQVCLRLPMLGLQLIDPLLLKHPAIDPPRKERKKWEKNQLILNGLTKPCTAQA